MSSASYCLEHASDSYLVGFLNRIALDIVGASNNSLVAISGGPTLLRAKKEPFLIIRFTSIVSYLIRANICFHYCLMRLLFFINLISF